MVWIKMAGFTVREFLLNTEGLLESLEDVLTKNENLLTAVQGSQSQTEENSGEHRVFHSLKARLATAQGSNERLSSELVKFQTSLRKIVDTINQCEIDQTYFEKESERLEKRQCKLKLEKQCFEDEVTAFELELKKFRSVNCTKSVENEAERSGSTRQNLTLENFRRLLIEEKKSAEEFCNSITKTEQELSDANKTIKVLKQSNGDMLKEMDKLRRHSDQLLSKMRENLFQVKKQQLAVTTEMRLAQEETERYRHFFRMGNENAVSEKPCSNHHNSEKLVSVGSSRLESNRLLSSRMTKQPATLLQRACTAPVSTARARMMMKQGDILKLTEALVDENSKLKNELHRMKQEQVILQKRANEATSAMHFMRNQLCVSMSGKEELQKQLHKTREQNQRLEKALKCQANDLTHTRKQQKQLEEEIRWSKIGPVSVLGAPGRYHSQSQHDTGSTRNIAVAKWNNTR